MPPRPLSLPRPWLLSGPALALLVGLAPALALACPSCAVQDPGPQAGLWLVGALLALPVVLGGGLLWLVRRLLAGERGE